MAQDDIQALAPDGSTHIFPAGTGDDVIDRTMKSYISGNNQTQQQQETPAKSFNQQLTEQRPLAPFDSSHPIKSIVHDVGTELGNFGAGGINSVEAMAHPINTAKSMVKSLPSALRAAGEENAPNIDPAYAAGSVVPFLGAGELVANAPDIVRGVKNLPDTVSNAKNSLIDATRDPTTGKLFPNVREKAQLGLAAAGAIGGGLAGGIEGGAAGAYGGFRIAPALADVLLPKRPMPSPLDFQMATGREEMYNDLASRRMARGAAQEKLDNADQESQQEMVTARDQMYNDLAKSKMARQSQQDALDQAATRASQVRMRLERQAQEQQGSVMASDIQQAKDVEQAQLQAAAENKARDAQTEQDQISQMEQGLKDQFKQRQGELSDRAKLNNQWGGALNQRDPYAPASSSENTPETQSPYSPAPSNPQDLISRTRRLVQPGAEPTEMDIKRAGDLTQAPIGRLKDLAKFGDKLAQNEINRRLKNP